MLPVKTTIDDVLEVCRYLSSKPTGSTIADAKAVIDKKRLDPRKISALKFWKLITDQDSRLKISESGRILIKGESEQHNILMDVIRSCPPYNAIIERAIHKHEDSFTSNDVAAHWHEHFRSDVSDKESTLNDQAVCFFQIVTGAGLGTLIIGRVGRPTRISFNVGALNAFMKTPFDSIEVIMDEDPPEQKEQSKKSDNSEEEKEREEPKAELGKSGLSQGIFVAHGKNKKPLEQLKKVLEAFKIPYKVSVDEPNLGRPISGKVRSVMESCNCAILIFSADEEFKDAEGKSIWRPSENVVYELGATGYLYDNRLVIMKEEGVTFPSNFRDIGYISFDKDNLEAKAMDILRELIGFGIVKIST